MAEKVELVETFIQNGKTMERIRICGSYGEAVMLKHHLENEGLVGRGVDPVLNRFIRKPKTLS